MQYELDCLYPAGKKDNSDSDNMTEQKNIAYLFTVIQHNAKYAQSKVRK